MYVGQFTSVDQYQILSLRKEDASPISTGKGEIIYELLGKSSGNEHLSIAFVEVIKNGASQPHYHPLVEESYIITEGEGRLMIDGQTKIVKKGDVAQIPVGRVHQIFNDNQENLQFFVVCASAWTPDCMVSAEMPKPLGDYKITALKKEEVIPIDTGKGEVIYELLGKATKNTKQSVAFVEIRENGSSNAHYHPVVEESYIITEGEGRLVIDGQTKIVKKGDVAQIPVGRVHQLFNDKKEELQFFVVCGPAWTPDCMILV